MSRQARNVGGVRSAVIAVDPSSFSAELRSPLTMRLIFNSARMPDWLHFDRRDLGLAFTLAVAVTFINTSGSLPLLDRSLLMIAEFAGSSLLESTAQYVVLVALLKG